MERFITVANIETPDHGKTILEGNGRVLAARLTDARFFWDNDLRKSLDEMAKPLENVVFHAKLGTQSERIDRIAALAREIALQIRANPDLAEQAARVAKSDLASEMVYEFPELQGVMGGYYARAAGLPDEVANACEAHYRPLGPTDAVPSEPVSVAVALADKIDMLTEFWAIDEKPTGSKDPFALRRAALGVVRTVLDNGLRLSLSEQINHQLSMSCRSLASEWKLAQEYLDYARDSELKVILDENDKPKLKSDLVMLSEISESKSAYSICCEGRAYVRHDFKPFFTKVDPQDPKVPFSNFEVEFDVDVHRKFELADVSADLLSFFADRLKVYLRDQGIRHDVIQACFDLGGQDDLVLLVNRVRALQTFLGTEDGANLLTGYKRAANIVAAEEKKDGVEYSGAPDVKFTELDQERALFAALDTAEPAIKTALEAEDFAAAMGEMAKLRPVIDNFFDKVTVNADNQIVRRNRLCLLTRIRSVMRQVVVWEAIEG
ncbi:MAG TPA: glycine--tRNA ligase subunit beta [Devosiaceae bacterium]|nr:glycine--tRNA ligase subunit beta [Devosiaceae bacterium]